MTMKLDLMMTTNRPGVEEELAADLAAHLRLSCRDHLPRPPQHSILHLCLTPFINRVRAKRERITKFAGLFPEILGQNLVLTVLNVPCWLE